MTKRPWRSILLTASLLAVHVTYAQPVSSPWERGSLQFGGFVSKTSSELRLDSTTLGLGATVDLEDGLGLGSNFSTYRIDGFYRFGNTRRHQIDAHYYVSEREGTRTIDRDLQIGDTIFPAGSGVASELDLWFLNVDYSYAFWQDDRVRTSGAVGLHVMGIDLRIATTGGALDEEEDVAAPLPVLGLRGEVALTQRWRVKGAVHLFYLKFDEYEGSLTDTSLALEYLPFTNVGFGLEVNSVRYGVRAEADSDVVDLNGKAQLNFVGALLYLKLFF